MTWQIFEDDNTLEFKRWYEPSKLWIEIKQDKGGPDNEFEAQITDGESIVAQATSSTFYGSFDKVLAIVAGRKIT